jgi:hypothetical protein
MKHAALGALAALVIGYAVELILAMRGATP